jgi:hypothetical protein
MKIRHGSPEALRRTAKAGPLPDEISSLGYPVTIIPWGKAQAGDSPPPRYLLPFFRSRYVSS